MHKLLIVDDERNIRLGIQAMISRAFPETFEFLLASNGLEALELLNSNEIDILLTDIKMPEMDGIRLVQSIQNLAYKPTVLIISGCDDFQYAKEAIKFRVKDYLLKPINRNELKQTLERVLLEAEVEQNTKKAANEYCSNQLNYIFIHPKIREEEVNKIVTNLQLDAFMDGYYVGAMKFHESSEEENVAYVEDMIAKYCSCSEYFCFRDKDGNVIILTCEEQLFHTLKAHMKSKRSSLGISVRHTHLQHIKTAYEQAIFALKNYFLYPEKPLIHFSHVNKSKITDHDIPVDNLKKIFHMIGTNREQEIKTSLLEVLNLEEITKQGIEYMELLSRSINTIILDAAYHRLGEDSVEILKRYDKVGYIYHFKSFYDYYYALEEMIFLLHEYQKQLKSVYSEQKYMEMAIKYIHDNYNQDINLAVVSNYVSLNYSYFSHMFKEYTGHSFVDYLKKVRIEQAKTLLTSPELKIYEVSSLVGYKNPKQFTRVFREFVGIAPKEYQEKLLVD
nr:response regulator [Paenibacillus bovis]